VPHEEAQADEVEEGIAYGDDGEQAVDYVHLDVSAAVDKDDEEIEDDSGEDDN